MTGLKERLPTIEAILPVYAVICLAVYSWTLYRLAYFIPGWINAMSITEILAVVCYGLAFDLFESLLLLVALILPAFILPGALFRERFSPQAILMVLAVTVVAIVLQDNIQVFYEWQPGQFRLGLLAVCASLVVLFFISFLLVKYVKGLANFIRSLGERAMVFLYLYMPLSGLSLILILIMNIF